MEPLHPCPCCGYFTFTAAPPYTLQFCEICFWEDGGEQSLSSLRYAQRNFLTLGACDPVFRHDVRLPDVSDRRVEQWQPLDTLKLPAQPLCNPLPQHLTALFEVVESHSTKQM
ncbi:MAG: hypothetical protein KME15_08595 [Drouetiella hepatica Uher 2000/2452]|jgi:hypothetical protein|uniref:Cysteine-rich CPCC domain-containing protein n=1 Tax=Drouetiella hepatica Uher 2000/2452 TaxID=904376 RepID=A0A951QBA8_9CYAN|nr:hypothetical protein [Drouetiella hepatica Uher 2000/2452]